jgi:hypothetical protein
LMLPRSCRPSSKISGTKRDNDASRGSDQFPNKLILKVFRGRLIGRTPAFGAGYHGSSPCPGANFFSDLQQFITARFNRCSGLDHFRVALPSLELLALSPRTEMPRRLASTTTSSNCCAAGIVNLMRLPLVERRALLQSLVSIRDKRLGISEAGAHELLAAVREQ